MRLPWNAGAFAPVLPLPGLDWPEGVGERVVSNGVFVGNYTMATPGNPSLDVYCVDFLNSVHLGAPPWNAYFSPLSDGGSLEYTRHQEDGRPLYQRAAWLSTQFAQHNKGEWGRDPRCTLDHNGAGQWRARSPPRPAA